MAHAVWSGVLSFGLVAVPIQLFSATESHTIRFNQIQRGTSDRIRNKRVNERTGEEVPLDQIVKGYDLGDQYVVVEPRELDEIAPGRSKSLDITGFVDLEQVNPIYFDKSYYMAPRGQEYAKVYSLLLEALTASGKAGIATFVMRNHEYLVAVKAESGLLALHTLHWADEVRDPRLELGNLPEPSLSNERELKTAVQLVEALSIDWDPEEYHDTYQEQVLALVEAKRAGESLEKGAQPPSSTNVIDLMAALQASVEKAKGARGSDADDAATRADTDTGDKASGEPPAATRLHEKRAAKRSSRPHKDERAQAEGKGAASPSELEGLTKAELYQRAADADVPGRSTMSREQLIQALSRTHGKRRAKVS
jgi:DNA end-binding protein Ku